MKRYILIMCAAIFGMAAHAALTPTLVEPTNGDGSASNPYEICSRENLYWFADQVKDNPSLCARLQNNIIVNPALLDSDGMPERGYNINDALLWSGMCPGKGFTGTFDGNGHVIRGLFGGLFGDNNVGLFDKLGAGAVIKNLGIEDSFFTTSAGSFAKTTSGDDFCIQNCYSTATIYTNSGDAVAGIIMNVANSGTLENCLFAGRIISEQNNITSYGGIVASVAASANVNITHCYTTTSSANQELNNKTYVSAEEMASGRLTWIMNGQSATNPTWYQSIGNDAYPNLKSDADRTVYYSFLSDSYTNEYTHEPEYSLEDKRVYIKSEADLRWLAAAVNSGKWPYDAELCNDITLSGVQWIPIGTEEHPFARCFWGNGHHISGLRYESSATVDAGLFGTTSGATINCLGLEDVRMMVAPDKESRIGALCGYATGDTRIDHCYVRGLITCSTISGLCGGLCGYMNEGTISLCYAAMNMAGQNPDWIGAICGRVRDSQIKNCHYLLRNADDTDGFAAGVGQRLVATDKEYAMECIGHGVEDFASGAVCYALAPHSREDRQWGQKLGTEPWPLPYNLTERKNAVYPVHACHGPIHHYTNSYYDYLNITEHTRYLTSGGDPCYQNGFYCQYCEVNPEEPQMGEQNRRLITNAGNLYWLAQHPGNYSVQLEADITVNDNLLNEDGTLKVAPVTLRKWVPISGSWISIFGQNHVIRGLYCVEEHAALVDMADNNQPLSVINDLGLEDCYMAGTSTSSSFGYRLGAQITHCYSTATLVAPTVDARVELLVQDGYCRMENVWYAGRVENGNAVSMLNASSTAIPDNNAVASAITNAEHLAYNEGALQRFRSGAVTWQLNGSKVGGYWFQQLEGEHPDALPRFSGNLLVDRDGDTYYNISLCDGQIRKHSMTHKDKVTLTCLHDGCNEHYFCALCQKPFADARGMEMLDEQATFFPREHEFSAHVMHLIHDYHCKEGGHWDYYHCEQCDNNFSEDNANTDQYLVDDLKTLERPILGTHTLTKMDGKRPSCFTPGTYDYYHCEECLNYYSDYLGNEPYTVVPRYAADVEASPLAVPAENLSAEWSEVESFDAGFDNIYTDMLCAEIGSTNKTLNFVLPEKATNPTLIFALRKGQTDVAQPLLMNVKINDVITSTYSITSDKTASYYKGSKAPILPTAKEGDKISIEISPILPLDATDCKIYLKMESTLIHHDLVLQKGDYDCKAGGHVDFYTCSHCGYNYSSKAHAWCDDDLLLGESATQEGVGHHADLSHREGLAPTCGVAGYEAYWQCGVCNAILAGNDANLDRMEAPTPIDPTGNHTFSQLSAPSTLTGLCSAICSVCQQEDAEHLYIREGLGSQNICLTGSMGNFHAEALNLPDGTSFYSPVEFTADAITYTRTLSTRYWMPLFLPYDVNHEDWAENFDVAELQNIHQYTDADGEVTRTVLEYVRINEGRIQGGRPYVIRPKVASAEPQTLVVHNATVRPTELETIWCASTKRRYNFTGTYNTLPNILGKHYIAVDGTMYYDNVGIALRPLRWYMEEVEHDGTPLSPGLQTRSMQILVMDDDDNGGITGIINVVEHDDYHTANGNSQHPVAYDLQGRAVNADACKGVHITNGKKLLMR